MASQGLLGRRFDFGEVVARWRASRRKRDVTTKHVALTPRRSLGQAKRQLASTNLTIEQIGRKLGFSTPSNFSRTFLRVSGRSPSDFRDQVREG